MAAFSESSAVAAAGAAARVSRRSSRCAACGWTPNLGPTRTRQYHYLKQLPSARPNAWTSSLLMSQERGSDRTSPSARPRVPVVQKTPEFSRPRVPVPSKPDDLVDELNQVKQVFADVMPPDAAQSAFSAVLASDRFGGEWRQVLNALQSTGGLNGSGLAKLVSNNPEVLALSADLVLRPMLHFLADEIGLYGYSLRRTLLTMPRLLQTPLGGQPVQQELTTRPVVRGRNPEPREVVRILTEMGLDIVDIRYMVAKYPGFLLLPPARINGVLDFLGREIIGFNRPSIGPLIKRAPWVLAYQATADLEPVGRFLASIGLIPSEPLIRSHPGVLGADVEYQLRPVYRFLISLGIRFDSVPRMLTMYPRLLTTSIPGRIQPVLDYLEGLGLTPEEIASIVRSFPSTLLLDVNDDIKPKNEYFAARGITNMRRLIIRVPALLSYDLATVVVPKYNYLERRINLTNYDLLRFPAYFQYDLETRIWPRTAFVLSLGLRLEEVGLNNTLAPTDEDFCAWTVKAELADYSNFVEKLPPVKGSRSLKRSNRKRRQRPRPETRIPRVDGRLIE